jgi:hypothetical protein
MTLLRLVATALCAFGVSAPAAGQVGAPRPPREPRFEVSFGGHFASGYDLTGASADLIRNQGGGGDYRVFQADSRIAGAPGGEARVGWRLSPRFTVEGGVLVTRPRLESRLSNDVENAPDLTAEEDLSLYILDGALIAAFGTTRSGRVTPFVRVGAGYLRQLHENNLLVETGQAYHAGGGVTAWFGRRPGRMGLRVDARIYVLQGGIDLESSSTRTMATGGGAFVLAF